MDKTIELRGFMDLAALFAKRGWTMPYECEIAGSMSGTELIAALDIPKDRVEVVFVNGKAALPETAVIRPGDRVALVPPGTPGPYRVLLGFKTDTNAMRQEPIL